MSEDKAIAIIDAVDRLANLRAMRHIYVTVLGDNSNAASCDWEATKARERLKKALMEQEES